MRGSASEGGMVMIKICSFYEVGEGASVWSIALSKPKGIRVVGKVGCLCPTWDMVKKLKGGLMSEVEYVDKYRKLIVKRWVEVKAWLDSLDNDVDICLCCWERSGFCHRFLVEKLIRKFRKDLEVSAS